MKIVKLCKADSEKIATIFEKSFSDGWSEKMIKDGFDGGLLNAFGIENEGEFVGVITFSLGLDSVDIEDVAVLPNYRRHGFAKMLIETVIADVKEKGIDKILLEVRKSNDGAIKLYQGQGFNKISERKKYYQNGEDAIVMLKEI